MVAGVHNQLDELSINRIAHKERKGVTKMSKRTVVGVLLTSRVTTAKEVQQVFTDYGCNIKTRIGLHDSGEGVCSPSGLILLEMYGDDSKIAEMEQKLKSFDGVETKKMVFEG